jgi:hypothetical protein
MTLPDSPRPPQAGSALPAGWNPSGKKLILSLDGGGMRGAVTVAVLAELEAYLGRPLARVFDMITGTSTGAIIAVALAMGMSARDILDDIYMRRLPGAFAASRGEGWWYWARFAFNGFRHLYPIQPFEAAMLPIARGLRLRDIERPIVLLTTKDVRTGAMCYLINRGPGAAAFRDIPLAGAVAASGAAPIFFPPLGGNLIDGGIGVDANPCLAAAIEAMEYLGEPEGFTPGRVILMSFGTGYVPNEFEDGDAGRFNAVDWIAYLVKDSIDDAALQQTLSTRAIYRHSIDFRRYNPAFTLDALHALGISPLGRPNPRLLSLDSYQQPAVTLMADIGRAYGQRIDWTQPDVMPWDTVGGHPKPSLSRAQIDWSRTIYGRGLYGRSRW